MKKEDWRNRFQIKNENFYGILLLKMSTDEIADAISMLESGIILEDWTDEFIASIIEAKEKRERGPVTSGDIIAEQDAEYDEIVELEEERRLKVIADEEEEIQREAKRAVEAKRAIEASVEIKHPSLDELRRLRCMWFDKEVKKDN